MKIFACSSIGLLLGVILAEASTSADYPAQPDYSFAYDVVHPYVGQDFGHKEERKKSVVTGEYRVLLPDDRMQRVRYQADHNGYVADVQYSDGTKSVAYEIGKSAKVPSSPSSYYRSPSTTAGYGSPPSPSQNYYEKSGYPSQSTGTYPSPADYGTGGGYSAFASGAYPSSNYASYKPISAYRDGYSLSADAYGCKCPP